MSEKIGLKHISDEVIEKAAEAWYNRPASRLGVKKYAELSESVQKNIQRDARALLGFIEEFQ